MHRSLSHRRRWLTPLALLASGLAASTLAAEPPADAPSATSAAPAADASTLADVQDRLATALKSYLLLQDENAQLKADLDKQAAERGALAEQLAAARATIGSLQVTAAASAQITPLQNELRQAQAETAALAAENADLRTRLALQSPAPGRWPSPERPAAAAPAASGGGFASDNVPPAPGVAAQSAPTAPDPSDDAPAMPPPAPQPAPRAPVSALAKKPAPKAATPASVPTAAPSVAPAPPVIAPVGPVPVTATVTLAPVAAVAPVGAVAPVATAAPAAAPRIHKVAENETLTLISKHYYGTTRRWKDILAANPTVIKGEKGLVVGSSIVIPP
jgi:regulator of replication initiation timing